MNEKELKKIFDFLNKEINTKGLFYFKMINSKNIKAYWKDDDTEFATIYVEPILQCLEELENKESED